MDASIGKRFSRAKSLPPGAPVTAPPELRRREGVDALELGVLDLEDDHLGDPVATLDLHGDGRIPVHEDDLDFAAVPGVDEPRRVEYAESLVRGASGARLDEASVADGD